MKTVIKIITILFFACVLKFYLFDLPRQMYSLKKYIEIQAEIDSLQTEYVRQLVKNNNLLIDYLKQNTTTAP